MFIDSDFGSGTSFPQDAAPAPVFSITHLPAVVIGLSVENNPLKKKRGKKKAAALTIIYVNAAALFLQCFHVMYSEEMLREDGKSI